MGSSNFLPYSTQTISEQDIAAVTKALSDAYLTQGPAVANFEEAFAKDVGADHAVAVANGTAALHLAMLALGIGPGDEVITTPNTFVATANAVRYCGATPVFADIDPATANLDPVSAASKITAKTKAIAVVDFSGTPANWPAFKALAEKHDLALIDDAAHAYGATINGYKVGSGAYADVTTFSFHPVKSMTTGEGGIITTNRQELYRDMKRLSTHGVTKDPAQMTKNEGPWYYQMLDLGFNYRLTDFQAALGLSQLKQAPDFISKRQELASRYNKAFESASHVTPLVVPDNATSGQHLYVLKWEFEQLGVTRLDVMQQLRDQGIGTQVHYIPVYHQPAYEEFGANPSDFSNTERYYKQALSIPLYPRLSDEDQQRVIDAVLGVAS